MARAPSNSYGQSRYTDQLLQSVLVPTIVSNTLNGVDFYTIKTDVSASSVRADSIYATNVFASNTVVGDLATETVTVGARSMQGTFTQQLSSTVLGVRAVGNSDAHGTFNKNVVVGAQAGLNLFNTESSVYVGAGAGTYGQATSNVVVGAAAGVGVTGTIPTVGNTFLGAGAGASNVGDSNVFIGFNAGADLSSGYSNTLVINNKISSVNALLYGKFDTRQLGINTVPRPSYALDISGGDTRINRDLYVDGTIFGAISTGGLAGGGNGPYGGVLLSNSTISGNGANITNLNATNITSGTLANSFIPNLPTSKITSGTFADSFIPSLAASKITTGIFADSLIPSLSASKITTGTFDSNLVNGGINGTYGGVVLSNSFISGDGRNLTNLPIPAVAGGSNGNYGGVILSNGVISLNETQVGYRFQPAQQNSGIGQIYLTNLSGNSVFSAGEVMNQTGGFTQGLRLSDLSASVTTVLLFAKVNSKNTIDGVFLQNSSVSASFFQGDGSLLSNLDGSKISSGSINSSRVNGGANGLYGGLTLSNGIITGDGSGLSNVPSSGGGGANGTYGGVLLSNGNAITENGSLYAGNTSAQFTSMNISFIQVRDATTANRFLIGNPAGSAYTFGAYSNGFSNFILDSATGNISNLATSSNYIGGVTLSGGRMFGTSLSLLGAPFSSNMVVPYGTVNTPSRQSNYILETGTYMFNVSSTIVTSNGNAVYDYQGVIFKVPNHTITTASLVPLLLAFNDGFTQVVYNEPQYSISDNIIRFGLPGFTTTNLNFISQVLATFAYNWAIYKL